MMLCGVEIPCNYGLAGHSDADAPLHALTDALLGALALGDIGKLFPDTDQAYLNADSVVLLQKAYSLEAFREWEISSIDITIVAQKPKIAPHTEAMRARIAGALNIDVDCVSIKGKTTEGMGFCGRGEGLQTFAQVLLERKG
jgi:2-C-methyl-D-erythritol 2,4-cyclodiphosphate synthase